MAFSLFQWQLPGERRGEDGVPRADLMRWFSVRTILLTSSCRPGMGRSALRTSMIAPSGSLLSVNAPCYNCSCIIFRLSYSLFSQIFDEDLFSK